MRRLLSKAKKQSLHLEETLLRCKDLNNKKGER